MIISLSKKQHGFTLVELAISLMVIGLLIGGVLKGQSLIDNAKIIRLVKDISDYETAAMIFQSTYGDLPGNIHNPSSLLPNCNTAPCNLAPAGYLQSGQQSTQFWLHLDRAGLIKGINVEGIENAASLDDAAFIASPQNAFNSHTVPTYTAIDTYNSADIPKYRFALATIAPPSNPALPATPRAHSLYASAIDTKIDDGKPTTGKVQYGIQVRLSPWVWGSGGCIDPTTLEYRRDKNYTCALLVEMSSAP